MLFIFHFLNPFIKVFINQLNLKKFKRVNRVLVNSFWNTIQLSLRVIDIHINIFNTQSKLDLLTPELVEDDYEFDQPVKRIRTGIRDIKGGLRLHLKIIIIDESTCQPIPNMSVDFLSCDTFGCHSGYSVFNNFEQNATILPGVQTTDSNGSVEFIIVFPDWYYGLPLHIYVESFINKRIVYSGTIYFIEEIAAKQVGMKPHSVHKLRRKRDSEENLIEKELYRTLFSRRQISGDTDENGLNTELVMAVMAEHNH